MPALPSAPALRRTPDSLRRTPDSKEGCDPAARQPRPARPARPALFVPVVLASQLMVVLDGTVVNVALPHIQQSLRFSSTTLSWVLNAYILAFGGLLMLGARSGDLLGRRRTFLAGIALFSSASLAGGFATSSWMLLACRGAQGVGGALVAPSTLALLTAAFPEGRERLRAIALFATVSAAGAALGLVAGGLLTEWGSWRWVMFVNVPIGAALLVIAPRVIVETRRRSGRFDIAGAATSTLGMAVIVLGLVEAGSVGFTDPLVIAALAAGVVLVAIFVRNEARAAEPILPLRLLASRTRSAANAARGLVYAGMYGTFFFTSQYLQDVRLESPTRAGLAFLPIPLGLFAGSQLSSRGALNRLRPKAVMLVGIGLTAAALAAVSRIGSGTSMVIVLAELVPLGLGMGISLVGLTSASLAGVSPADAGAASGLVNVAQQLGAALGLAVLVTVFGDATGHAHLVSSAGPLTAHAEAVLVHGVDRALAVAAGFAALSLVIVGFGVRQPAPSPSLAAAAEQGRGERLSAGVRAETDLEKMPARHHLPDERGAGLSRSLPLTGRSAAGALRVRPAPAHVHGGASQG